MPPTVVVMMMKLVVGVSLMELAGGKLVAEAGLMVGMMIVGVRYLFVSTKAHITGRLK